MAQWKKGQSGNPKGKPKGATNHTTRVIKEAIASHFEGNIETYLSELKGMKAGHAKFNAICTLLSFCLPKPTDPVKLDINSMNETELHELLKEAYAKGSD